MLIELNQQLRRTVDRSAPDEPERTLVALAIEASITDRPSGRLTAATADEEHPDADSAEPLGTLGAVRDLRIEMQRADLRLTNHAKRGIDKIERSRAADPAVVTLAELIAVQDAVDRMSELMRSSGRHGVALVDTSPSVGRLGLLTSWSGSASRPELLRTSSTAVGVVEGVMSIDFLDRRPSIVDVQEFQLTVDGALVRDGAGELHALAGDATQMLFDLAPDSTGWRVRRVPEVLVWADMRAAIQTVVQDALLMGCGALVLHSRPIGC